MTGFGLINRAFLKDSVPRQMPQGYKGLLWQTCIRQVYLVDAADFESSGMSHGDEIYWGLDADVFLAEILCGLKSPLIGETEVFGQFKLWWNSISSEHYFKSKYKSRMDTIFALVKTVREKALCGHGSQSYGSLMRRFLKTEDRVDIIGAGHLASELLPWIPNQSGVRIWCRNPHKVENMPEVIPMNESRELAPFVVVAAPMSHEVLTDWLSSRGFSRYHSLFDFRADSHSYEAPFTLVLHKKLEDFSSEFEVNKSEIELKAREARRLIRDWAQIQESKSIVRPFGWDDL